MQSSSGSVHLMRGAVTPLSSDIPHLFVVLSFLALWSTIPFSIDLQHFLVSVKLLLLTPATALTSQLCITRSFHISADCYDYRQSALPQVSGNHIVGEGTLIAFENMGYIDNSLGSMLIP